MRKDGSLFDASVTLSAMRNPDGKLVGFVKVTRDVSERKTWERKLQTGEQQYNHIFEAFERPTLWCEPDGRIVRANAALRTCLGLDETALVGRPFKSLAEPADRDRIDAATTAVKDGAEETLSFVVIDNERSGREMRWTLTPITVDSMTTGFFAAARDAPDARDAGAAGE